MIGTATLHTTAFTIIGETVMGWWPDDLFAVTEKVDVTLFFL